LRRWRETDRFFVRREARRLRFRYRAGLLVLILGLGWLSAPVWLPFVADPLVADYAGAPAEVVVAEAWHSLDVRMARDIASVCRGRRIYVVLDGVDSDDPEETPDRFARSLARLAKAGVDTALVTLLLTPKRPDTPGYTSFYARHVRERMERDGVRSLTLVTGYFHSRRSHLIYRRAFAGSGIAIDCYPSSLGSDRADWWRMHAGMLSVLTEYIKMFYYLPRGFQ
jgi:hypothetical protein